MDRTALIAALSAGLLAPAGGVADDPPSSPPSPICSDAAPSEPAAPQTAPPPRP